MRKVISITILTLLTLCVFCQTNTSINKPYPYTKIEPLVSKIDGEKIKMVMANYHHNEIIVITRKQSVTLTKRQASDLGIIPPLPEIKPFQISSQLYRGVINIVEIRDLDLKQEKIVSNEAIVYNNDSSSKFKAEVYIPDSVTFYKINLQTNDTVGVCKKEILSLPASENTKPEISFGNIFGKLVTKELLKEQTEIKLPPGYEFAGATVYFAGVDSFKIFVRSLTTADLSPLKSILDSCNAGSTIVLDNVRVKTPSGKLMRSSIPVIKVGEVAQPFDFTVPKIQFGMITQPRANHLDFKVQKKIYVPDHYEFISAVIHFGGAGFNIVYTLEIKTDNIEILKEYLKDCRPGTIVQIDNIKLKDNKGSIVNAEDFVCALF